jgi:ligand-binding sensor domain-containing protein/signal transduction histidine kinase
VPGPLTVSVPVKEGGFYTVKRSNGDISKVVLKPPAKKMLAVLMDEKGVPVKDAAGNPFIMGSGGISNFTNFTSDDGLALDYVNCSMMDKVGGLWFGTQGGGASRYDGQSFTNFSTTQGLAYNSVLCLFQDMAGNIWFGTQAGGASKYDGKTFTSFTTARGLPNDWVRTIFEDRHGNIWFGTLKGASKYDGKTFINYTTAQGLADNDVNFIDQDRAGNLWFCTNGGVSKFDGKRFTGYTSAQGLAGNTVNCMAETKDGTLWFGTEGGGASRYDGRTFASFATGQGLQNDRVKAIFEDKSGNIWFCTSGGATKYAGKTFTNFTIGQGLASNEVNSITEDKSGNLWFCTNGGLSKYAGNSFTSFTTAQGLANNSVFSIDQDRAGNYWFCTEDGVSKYDGRSFTNFTTAQGLANNYVLGMTEDKAGNLWFGTLRGGASKYDGKSFTSFTTAQGLASNIVFAIEQDKNGNIWFGTNGGGLSKYNGKSFTNYTTAQGLVDNNVMFLHQDKGGNLWLSTNGGVSRFNGKTFINFTTAQGLANNYTQKIDEDKDGNLWVGTISGISRLSAKEMAKLKAFDDSPKEVPVVQFDNFTTAQGLADDYVYDEVQDKEGNMFIGTNLGFTVIPAPFISLPFSQVRKGIEYYNKPNGYPVRDLNSNAMYCDSQGIVWGGTGSGLVRFDHSSLHKEEAEPVLVIQRIKVDGENICWFDLQSGGKLDNAEDSAKSMYQESMAYGKIISPADRDLVIKRFGDIRFDSISSFYPLPNNLELPHDKNQVTIDFNAVETGKPQQMEYQYMLRGYDKDWDPVTKSTTATFGNMYEGRYTFIVKARKSNGGWSEPVTYSFKVLPPWYRTWWAYSFYGLFLLAGLILTDRIRRRVLEERLLAKTREKELAHAKEIEKAYKQLESAHETLKATQAQLVQSEKMASLGELTAGIAHEIQNPLNFINNFSEVNTELIDELKDQLKKDIRDLKNEDEILNDIHENERKINHHGKRADAIVKGMLQHSRSGTGVKEPTDINALADEYLRLAYHGLRAKDSSFKATIKTDLDQSIHQINVIQQDIGRVLLNLYNNAFYAVAEKKKTAVEGYEPAISVSTQKSDDTITITVRDNGNGIPRKVIDKIFQPFFTTKPTGQGTGLGLSLSYNIIKANGGEIKVNTREGEFTEFVVQL